MPKIMFSLRIEPDHAVACILYAQQRMNRPLKPSRALAMCLRWFSEGEALPLLEGEALRQALEGLKAGTLLPDLNSNLDEDLIRAAELALRDLTPPDTQGVDT